MSTSDGLLLLLVLVMQSSPKHKYYANILTWISEEQGVRIYREDVVAKARCTGHELPPIEPHDMLRGNGSYSMSITSGWAHHVGTQRRGRECKHTGLSHCLFMTHLCVKALWMHLAGIPYT